MRTKYKDTQLESWETLKDSIGKKQFAVFSQIADYPKGVTLFELVELLKWPVNSISGRVTELSRDGWIVDSGIRKMNPKTGKSAVVWRLK